jgi:hypothetical protein
MGSPRKTASSPYASSPCRPSPLTFPIGSHGPCRCLSSSHRFNLAVSVLPGMPDLPFSDGSRTAAAFSGLPSSEAQALPTSFQSSLILAYRSFSVDFLSCQRHAVGQIGIDQYYPSGRFALVKRVVGRRSLIVDLELPWTPSYVVPQCLCHVIAGIFPFVLGVFRHVVGVTV